MERTATRVVRPSGRLRIKLPKLTLRLVSMLHLCVWILAFAWRMFNCFVPIGNLLVHLLEKSKGYSSVMTLLESYKFIWLFGFLKDLFLGWSGIAMIIGGFTLDYLIRQYSLAKSRRSRSRKVGGIGVVFLRLIKALYAFLAWTAKNVPRMISKFWRFATCKRHELHEKKTVSKDYICLAYTRPDGSVNEYVIDIKEKERFRIPDTGLVAVWNAEGSVDLIREADVQAEG